MISIGVAIMIAPSLLNTRVISKLIKLMYQNRRMPEFLESLAKKSATNWNTPKLSRTSAIAMVAIIVTDAPPTSEPITFKSSNETDPAMTISAAPARAGMDTLSPLGLHIINTIVATNEMIVSVTVNILFSSPFYLVVVHVVSS